MSKLLTCGQNYGGAGVNRVVRTAGMNATVEASFVTTATGILGVTELDGDIYYGNASGVFHNDGFTATQLGTLSLAAAGVTFDQSGNMVLANGASSVRKYSGFTSTVLGSFSTTYTSRGASFDAENVYWSDGTGANGGFYKGTGFSGTIQASVTRTLNIHDCTITGPGGNGIFLQSTSGIYVLSGMTDSVTQSISTSSYDGTTTGLEYIPTESRLGIVVPEDLSTASLVGVSWPLGVVSDIYGAPEIDTTYLEAHLSIAGITSQPSLDTAHFVMVLDIADLTASSVLDSPSPVLVVSGMQVNSILDRPIPVVVVSDLIGRPSIDVPVPFLVIKDMSVISSMDTVTLLTPASTLCNISFACSTPSVSFDVLS